MKKYWWLIMIDDTENPNPVGEWDIYVIWYNIPKLIYKWIKVYLSNVNYQKTTRQQRKNWEDMKEINNLLNNIKEDLQTRIDNNEFDYCDKSDMQLDLIDMNTDEFVRTVDKWDFNGSDNSIWYYTQIQTLEKVISILEKEQGRIMEEDRNKIIEQLMEEELERLKKDNNGR